ncbi:MAG: oligosaccharide flippase family protein [Clostridia bacterium]|nr:oligosaccharide flippase family protein [Clostridia bacterium]
MANGFLMTCVALTLRGLGVAFNAYISRKIGAEALGLYTLLGSVYSFALTLALSGINLTATRLVSDAIGEKNPEKARVSMKKCVCYSLFFGILSASLLLAFAKPLSVRALKDTRVIKPLRLCAATLPLISLTACFNGYFTAVRRVYKNAITQIGEQLARIVFCVALLDLFFGRDMESCCVALVLGGALSEMLSFSISLVFYVFERKSVGDGAFDVPNQSVEDGTFDVPQKINERKITRKMLGIALPLAFSTYFRSALLTIEHILIPIGIQKSGSNRAQSLVAYGTLQSMVMPLVLFPSAIIHSFSGLLVPELAELKIQNNKTEIKYVAGRVCHIALAFAIGVSGIMIFFADELGQGIYGSADAGQYIRFVAHIVPIMYLDTTVDNMLKGLGEHLYTMAINITDTLCSLVMVWILIPKMGIYGYITLIIVSEIFNSSASILKLVKVTKMRFRVAKWFVLPVISIFLSTWAVGLLREFTAISTLPAILLATLLYFTLLRVTRAIGKEEISWAKAVFKF